MLKHGEVNPLNVFGLRETSHCPPHFQQVSFDLRTDINTIKNWIYENLEGRFWLGDHYYTNGHGTVDMQKCAAFENHSEASYFSLLLDQINTSNFPEF